MDKNDYLKFAWEHMTEDFLLDAWWLYLAEKGIWYSANTKKAQKIKDLETPHLFNIKNGILQMCQGQQTIPHGACKLIGLIDFVLAKKPEEEGDLPF